MAEQEKTLEEFFIECDMKGVKGFVAPLINKRATLLPAISDWLCELDIIKSPSAFFDGTKASELFVIPVRWLKAVNERGDRLKILFHKGFMSHPDRIQVYYYKDFMDSIELFKDISIDRSDIARCIKEMKDTIEGMKANVEFFEDQLDILENVQTT